MSSLPSEIRFNIFKFLSLEDLKRLVFLDPDIIRDVVKTHHMLCYYETNTTSNFQTIGQLADDGFRIALYLNLGKCNEEDFEPLKNIYELNLCQYPTTRYRPFKNVHTVRIHIIGKLKNIGDFENVHTLCLMNGHTIPKDICTKTNVKELFIESTWDDIEGVGNRHLKGANRLDKLHLQTDGFCDNLNLVSSVPNLILEHCRHSDFSMLTSDVKSLTLIRHNYHIDLSKLHFDQLTLQCCKGVKIGSVNKLSLCSCHIPSGTVNLSLIQQPRFNKISCVQHSSWQRRWYAIMLRF